jgi:hypothetical protein
MAERFGPPVSIRFFPSMSGRPGVQGNEFIFTRDLPTGVMPIGGLKRSEDYRATLDPADDAVADRIVRLLDVGQFSRHELSEALTEFVETTTRYLGYRGEVIYEIVTVTGRNTGVAELRLIPLPPGRVIRTPWAFYQVIPKADREQLGKGWMVRISRSKLWRMTLPHQLGGVRRHRRMLKMLRTRSSPTTEFILQRIDMGHGVGYDFSAHHKACSIGIERATRRWGTMPSFFRVEGTTEYFSFSRRLDFKRSQAELRDHIITELNSFLGRLGFKHRIAVEGLVPPAKISEIMSRLQAGEVTVSEALDVDRS